MRLRHLFALKEYKECPRGDVMTLYAQGFSMSDYLVKRSNHGALLNFVGHGMQYGWDGAVQSFYGHRSVEELEEAWLKHLRDSRSNPQTAPIQVASNQGPNQQRPAAQPTNRPIVRLTVPPVQPLDPAPVVRGAQPSPDQVGQHFAPPRIPPLVVPQPSTAASTWVPAPGFTPNAQYLPPTVTLGAIRPDTSAAAPPQRYGSPVGFPR